MKHAKRDVSIELLRIIATLLVIGTHLKLKCVVNDDPIRMRVIIACFVGDGVAIFWMIMGCFFFEDQNYKRKLQHLYKKILIPMFLFSLATFYLFDYIVGVDATLLMSIRHTPQEYKNLLTKGILKWENAVPGCSHLWYLYVYVLVVLLFPLFQGVFDRIRKIKYGEVYLACILIGALIFNDLSFNGFFDFSHHTFRGALGAGIWIFIGYAFYQNRQYFEGKLRYVFIGAGAYLLVNLVRAYIQYHCYLLEKSTNEPLFWYTSYSVFSVLCLSMAVFGLSAYLKEGFLGDLIRHLGKMTFSIYMVHYVVLSFFNARGLQDRLYDPSKGAAGTLKYQILYTGIIFIVSLALSEIFSFAVKGLRTLTAGRKAAYHE